MRNMTSTVKTRNSAASLLQPIGTKISYDFSASSAANTVSSCFHFPFLFSPSVLQSPLNRNILEGVGVQAGFILQHKGKRNPMPGLKPFLLLEHFPGWEELCTPWGTLSSQPQISVHGIQVSLLGRTGILAWSQDAASMLPVLTVHSSQGKISHLLP